MKKDALERHRSYLSQIALIAEEMGYNVDFLNLENKPGEPDLIVVNPKNGRKAYVEVEVTFQQQVAHQRKVRNRWERIERELKEGKDSVLLMIGARRRDFLSLCERAGIPNPSGKYGKILFTCVSYSDQNEIRASLLRCLGDD